MPCALREPPNSEIGFWEVEHSGKRDGGKVLLGSLLRTVSNSALLLYVLEELAGHACSNDKFPKKSRITMDSLCSARLERDPSAPIPTLIREDLLEASYEEPFCHLVGAFVGDTTGPPLVDLI